MKIRVSCFFILCLLGFSWGSCGNKKSNDTFNNPVDSTHTEELFVWVENARVRKTPDLNGEVITEIKGGDQVALTGESSNAKIKVKLRGVDFEDVWVKIKLNDGKEGWIFKGMLTDDVTRAKAMNNFIIYPGDGVGMVTLNSKQKDIERIFGEQFVSPGIIYGTEGIEAPGFYVFKDSPLELQCIIDEHDSTIQTIKIKEPGSNWITEDGIKIGTTLDHLVKLNGKPIDFSGFGWDYGGWIFSFGSGKLSKLEGKMGICLGEPDDITGLDEFEGDRDCSTRNKKILGKGVKVAEITVYHPGEI
jgi:hypothetical protein